jgi:hypothetical protein
MQSKISRRVLYLLGVLIAMPVLVWVLLTLSYGAVASAAPDQYARFLVLLHASQVGVGEVSTLDLISALAGIAGTVIFGLLIGAFGLWLPYHTLFGNHGDRWPK